MAQRITPETALKRQVKDYLALRGVWNVPLLQGIGSYKGLPDRIAIKAGKTYFLEFKSPTGRLSEYQQEFKTNTEDAGGIYIEVRSVEDVAKYL